MVINTKLNINEEGWFLTTNQVRRATIESITISCNSAYPRITYHVKDNPAGSQYTKSFSEDEIFATKQDLLASM